MKRMIIRHVRPTAMAVLMAGTLSAAITPSLSEAHQPPGAENAPEGIVRANIVHEGGIDDMRVVILDAPKPAIMVSYQGEEMLTVFDSNNQPFLRFYRDRVEASTQSRHWNALPQSRGNTPDTNQSWVRVSGSGRFGWVDPRLSDESMDTPDSTAKWQIPVRQGRQEMAAIKGQRSWRPLAANVVSTHP